MQVLVRPLGRLKANCYVLQLGGSALVIDPGEPDPWLFAALEGLRLEAVLLTHAHFDHIGGVPALRPSAPVYVHELEAGWLTDPVLNRSAVRPQWCPSPISVGPPDGTVQGGTHLVFGPFRVGVRHVPGHSPGSVAYLIDELVFSGDALFNRSVGRTDLPGGDLAQLLGAIRTELMVLPAEFVLYPGHGPASTIGHERVQNPFLNGMLA